MCVTVPDRTEPRELAAQAISDFVAYARYLLILDCLSLLCHPVRIHLYETIRAPDSDSAADSTEVFVLYTNNLERFTIS